MLVEILGGVFHFSKFSDKELKLALRSGHNLHDALLRKVTTATEINKRQRKTERVCVCDVLTSRIVSSGRSTVNMV